MPTSWKELLARPGAGDHVAQIYQDPEFLIEAVSHFVISGLQQGEGVVLIMRQSHWRTLERRLQAEGADPAAAAQRGQLQQHDAEAMLARLMKNGMPDETAFREIVGGAIGQMRRPYPEVRAFGEMVDILWRRSQRVAAQHLEELWNDLVRARPFSLLCAYCMDPLADGTYGGPIEDVCKAHTHLIPARHYGRFDAAVSQASQEVLDRPLVNMLHMLAASHQPSTGMPLGQAILIWLKENMPRTADKILTRARARYAEMSNTLGDEIRATGKV